MLKADVYVKVILTVIAICLAVIAFRPVFSTPAKAHDEVVDVNIVRISGFLPNLLHSMEKLCRLKLLERCRLKLMVGMLLSQ